MKCKNCGEVKTHYVKLFKDKTLIGFHLWTITNGPGYKLLIKHYFKREPKSFIKLNALFCCFNCHSPIITEFPSSFYINMIEDEKTKSYKKIEGFQNDTK